MLASADLWVGIAGTVVLWAPSGLLAVALGFLFAAGSLRRQWTVFWAARVSVNLTRGVPTSLMVIAAGIGMMHLVSTPELPPVFPGTPAAFQHVAWGIMLALALGSAGHLAEIFVRPAWRWAASVSNRRRCWAYHPWTASGCWRGRPPPLPSHRPGRGSSITSITQPLLPSFRSRTSLGPFRGRRTPRSACSTLLCSGVRST